VLDGSGRATKTPSLAGSIRLAMLVAALLALGAALCAALMIPPGAGESKEAGAGPPFA